MEVFQWQERQNTTSVQTHMIAGVSAGIGEHLFMLPIDNVKTHCQVGKRMSIFNIMKKIYKSGGLSNFYSGSSIVLMGCAPAHAIFFSVYQRSLSYFKCNPETDVIKFAMVGAISNMFHDLIMTPTQALKQRMQLLRSQNSLITIRDVARKIYRTQGLLAFYRSFPINYSMNLPFGSLIVVFNEKLKHAFGVKQGNDSWKYYLCGAIAGGLSSIPTIPLDVIKTKLNTQDCVNQNCYNKKMCSMLLEKPEKNSQLINNSGLKNKFIRLLNLNTNNMSTYDRREIKYRTVFDTITTIIKQDGIKGFFKGLQLRVLMQSISSGLSWGTYQLVKNAITSRSIAH